MGKYLLYLKYVLKHKYFVFVECCKYKELGMIWRGLMHDMSKFRPSEFIPYARYFYGKDVPNIDAFNMAWLYHQKRNPHHWQFWILQNDLDGLKLMDMPDKYRKEMLADWRGAGKAIKGFDDTVNWYRDNKEKMCIHENAIAWIEEQLGVSE